MVNVKKALQSLWKDSLTVTEYQKVPNPDKSSGFKEVAVLEGQPCKLSFSTLQAANQNDSEAALAQAAKLFLDARVKIAPGSKIIVIRGNDTFEFNQSGLPGIFTSHQEIMLVPFKGWA